jgi:hypothetical protein
MPESDSPQNTFNISNSPIANLVGSGSIQVNLSAKKCEKLTTVYADRSIAIASPSPNAGQSAQPTSGKPC